MIAHDLHRTVTQSELLQLMRSNCDVAIGGGKIEAGNSGLSKAEILRHFEESCGVVRAANKEKLARKGAW